MLISVSVRRSVSCRCGGHLQAQKVNIFPKENLHTGRGELVSPRSLSSDRDAECGGESAPEELLKRTFFPTSLSKQKIITVESQGPFLKHTHVLATNWRALRYGTRAAWSLKRHFLFELRDAGIDKHKDTVLCHLRLPAPIGALIKSELWEGVIV